MNATPASVTDNCTNKFVGTDTRNTELPVTANQRHKFMALLTRNATCYLCSAEILAGVALVIRKVPIATPYGVYKARRVVCLSCSPGWGTGSPAFYCKTCKRPVYYAKRTNLPRYCSPACHHAARLVRPIAVVCTVCGKAFIAPRIDARTCSPACRQKAYRQRQQGAVQ